MLQWLKVVWWGWLLRNGTPESRKRAGDNLMRSGAAAVPSLARCLNAGNRNCKELAAEALGRIGDERGVAPLEEILQRSLIESKDAFLARAAIEALGRLQAVSAIPLLRYVVKNSSVGGHQIDMSEAGQFSQWRTVPSLPAEAAQALVHIFQQEAAGASVLEAVESLLAALCEAYGSDFDAMSHSLEEIDAHWRQTPPAARIVDKSIDALVKKGSGVSESRAIELLALVRDDRCIPPILKQLRKRPWNAQALFSLLYKLGWQPVEVADSVLSAVVFQQWDAAAALGAPARAPRWRTLRVSSTPASKATLGAPGPSTSTKGTRSMNRRSNRSFAPPWR